MAFVSTVMQVMIASPGDVTPEREMFRKVLSEWNATHARAKKIILLPVGWELDIAPELGAHPQVIINNRIVDSSDIMVGVFWTRVGTPTNKAMGGAIEEVQYHFNKGKPTLVYFSNKPISPEEIDSTQYALLKEFKGWVRRNGLYDSFADTREFGDKLMRGIQQTLNTSEYTASMLSKHETDGAVSSGEASRLDAFQGALLKALSQSSNRNFKVERLGEGLRISVEGEPPLVSTSQTELQHWLEKIVSLIGRGLLRDVTGRGEVFQITEAGHRLAGIL